MIKKSKRSQEEMIGFVLIIVLVAVIALVFLAISVRKPVQMIESKDTENFIQSSLLYTTSCQPSPEIKYNFKDLIKACYDGERCLSEENACDILNKTTFELIKNSFKIGEEAVYKAYNFTIYSEHKTLLELIKGDVKGNKIGSKTSIYISGENLYAELELFY